MPQQSHSHGQRNLIWALSLCTSLLSAPKSEAKTSTPPNYTVPDTTLRNVTFDRTHLEAALGTVEETNQSQSSHTAASHKNHPIKLREIAGLIGTLALGTLGYLNYIARSVPRESRSKHLSSRAGTLLLDSDGSYPGNTTALKIYCVNHSAVLLTGAMLAAQNHASLVTLATPAIFLLGSIEALRLSSQYGGQYPVSKAVRACEGLGYATLGLFAVSSTSRILGHPLSVFGIDPAMVGVGLGLLARTLSLTPMAEDFIREARQPSSSRGFPALKNHVLWTTGSSLSLLAMHAPLDASSWVPIGYFLQNAAILALGAACFRIHKNKTSHT